MTHRTRSIFAAGVAGAALSLCTGSAMAGIVHFINPDPGQEGHFDWHHQMRGDAETFEHWLDITKAPWEQNELATGRSVGQLCLGCGGDDDFNITSNGASVATIQEGVLTLTRALALGDPVHDNEFDLLSAHVARTGADEHSDFERNTPAYIGVRTSEGNYGWILVEWVQRGPDPRSFRRLAWAYETEVGVPINAGDVPGVGGVALFGLAGLARRRRRRA